MKDFLQQPKTWITAFALVVVGVFVGLGKLTLAEGEAQFVTLVAVLVGAFGIRSAGQAVGSAVGSALVAHFERSRPPAPMAPAPIGAAS